MLKKLTQLTFAIALSLSLAGYTVNGYEPDPVITAIVKLQPNLSRTEVLRISSALRSVYEDGTCSIPWQLVLSIAFHESSLRITAINSKSKDYGFMQISKNNIDKMSLNKIRLMSDYKYSLRVACKILSYNQSRYSHKVFYWLGLYRSGNALWKQNIRANAISYDKMVRSTAYKIGYRYNNRQIARAR